MNRRWFSQLIAVVSVGLLTSAFLPTIEAQTRFARRSTEPPEGFNRTSGRVAASSFADLLSEWQSLNEQLDSVTQQARRATVADKDELRFQYTELVQKANELLPNLRGATIDEYRNRPNQESEVTHTMLGLLAHEVQTDQIEGALELAAELIDNQCDHISLYNLAGRAAFCGNQFDDAKTLLTRAREQNAIDKQGEDYLRDLEIVRARWKNEVQIRQREAQDSDALPQVQLRTTQGDIILELFENEAPQTVGNFVHLVESGFYNGLTFHRVVANLMAQSGCPKGDGYGGPGYSIMDEVKSGHRNHFRGSLSMAKTDKPNSGGSQFFITYRSVPELDGKHAVFGRVLEGMDVVARLQKREANSKLEPDRIQTASVIYKRPHEYKPTKSR